MLEFILRAVLMVLALLVVVPALTGGKVAVRKGGFFRGLLALIVIGLTNSDRTDALPDSKTTPAQIRASITHEALISFEDGKGYKTLKRHLTACGLTPETYRAKWGLPSNYPMVAPGYSERRSAIAVSLQIRNGYRPGARKAAASQA